MGGYFTSISRVFQIPANRPRENTSKRVIVNLEEYLRGNLRGNLRGRSTSLLLYILVPVPVKYPPMELQELHTQVFRGDECPRPRTREIPPMELGGKVSFFSKCSITSSTFKVHSLGVLNFNSVVESSSWSQKVLLLKTKTFDQYKGEKNNCRLIFELFASSRSAK